MSEFKDGLITVTVVRFNFWAALKLLFGWTYYIRIKTATECLIGATRHDSNTEVLIPPRWLQRKHPGDMEAPAGKGPDDE